MSPLWEKTKQKNNRKGKYAKLPSPNLSKSFQGLAQDPNLIFFGVPSKLNSIKQKLIEGISLLTLPKKLCFAGMTVEAALVLPMFLFFFLNLGSAMEIMRFHGRIETALWSVGREMAIYGSAITGPGALVNLNSASGESTEDLAILQDLGNLALSYTYVGNRIEECLGKAYLESAPLKAGTKGLQYLGTNLLNNKDMLELQVTYQIEPLYSFGAFGRFAMENRYYGRLWTGYEVTGEKEAIYYLTENAEVFHTTKNCTHLMLAVKSVGWKEARTGVNEYGNLYRPCEKCAVGTPIAQVWIADKGDCYHFREGCSGLKRTYRAVDWEEAQRYRPCSRCGKGDT